MARYRILVLGASYGSLLGLKLAMAAHDTTLVCLPAEAELINRKGAIVRLPLRSGATVELCSRGWRGELLARGPSEVDPSRFDLIVLAMQEPQYRSPGVRELMAACARAKVPCMSIMNMPPLAYVRRIAGVDAAPLSDCYADASVWDAFEPTLMTLCSPDPQAFRPPEEPVNVLQVRLATNFKAARFDSEAHTEILRALARDIEAIRYDAGGGARVELPVKLKVHESIFVPLAKWAMLLAGNYRCVLDDSVRPIRDAVWSDPEASRAVYRWVMDLCVAFGARKEDLVPFEKYAEAARSLASPSSAARALAAGAQNIERVDRLVQRLAAQKGLRSASVDETVRRVDAWLERNRRKAQA